MQAVGIKIHFSLHYIKGFILKTSGSLSFGKVDQFRKGQMGSFSFGISTLQQSLKSVGNKIGFKFNMTMHVARHTFAVMSIKKGVSIHMVSRLMGHSSVLVTEKVYAEFLPSEINKIVREELSFSFG